jgi:DNA-binding MarR family transcriptional regulator
MSAAERIAPRPVHLTRLMAVWRSAGWPCRDGVELDLIAAGWVERRRDDAGRETLQVTEAGLELLHHARRRRLRSASVHDRIAARMCLELQRQGRIVWRELALRARVASAAAGRVPSAPAAVLPGLALDADTPCAEVGAWRSARPDLFSIRNSSLEAALHPVVHEIKASRADLLADLRDTGKGEAYRSVSSETYYVFPEGLADATEIPEDFGIWTLVGTPEDGMLSLRRPAPFTARSLGFGIWMALAKAAPVQEIVEPMQAALTQREDVGRN